MTLTTRSVWAVFGLPVLLSGASGIGTVVSDGRFNVNQMQVPGSATLFEGSTVESLKSAVTIQLDHGPRIDLQAGSSVHVYHDHLIVRTGAARARVDSGYRIETAGLVLQPSADRTTAVVRIADRGTNVAIPQGRMNVLNSAGTLLARVDPGLEVNYDNPGQQPVSTPADQQKVQLTGILQRSDGHLILRDNATQLIWELVGEVPASQLGKTITILGTVLQQRPVPSADRVARVDTVKKAVGGFPCFGGGGAPEGERIQLTGPIEKKEGHYVLTDQVSKVKSELIGNVPDYQDQTTVTIKGTLVKDRPPFNGTVQVIDVDHFKKGGGVLLTGCEKAAIAGLAVTAGVITIWEQVPGGGTPMVSQ
ncbi:MAG TPA: hypothetical protein VKU19_39575 [Bryobacteraceae bacterium]|nr:hypothetical protein [Bryobacteraceae bacterium]